MTNSLSLLNPSSSSSSSSSLSFLDQDFGGNCTCSCENSCDACGCYLRKGGSDEEEEEEGGGGGEGGESQVFKKPNGRIPFAMTLPNNVSAVLASCVCENRSPFRQTVKIGKKFFSLQNNPLLV